MIELITQYLVVREPRASDIVDWHRLLSDLNQMRFLLDIASHSLADSRHNLAEAMAQATAPDRQKVFLAIERQCDRAFVGCIGYTVQAKLPVGKQIEMGYFILPEFEGKGYTSEALQALIAFAFCHDDVYRIKIGCNAENAASKRVIEKAGLTLEATFKAYHWHESQLTDRLEYRLLKSEWQDEMEKLHECSGVEHFKRA